MSRVTDTCLTVIYVFAAVYDATPFHTYHGRGGVGGDDELRGKIAPLLPLREGRTMANSDVRGSEARDWRVLYRAAVFDSDKSEMAKRLADAEEAIVERMRELFRETGSDAQGEREALDDAIYALRALRVALEQRTRAA
ncbi:MAG: hypothetical protein WA741_10555 [Candidatus Sulfotelmatobacter sp.]